jgi:heme exporter protein D
VVVLYVWLAVGGVSLLVLAILGYGLFSQFTRLRKAVEAAQAELAPMIATLQPDTPQGRHRAG